MGVSAQPPVLAADQLFKTFPARRSSAALAALTDVSMSVTSGEIVGLVGESGSGKSTLSRILVGVERPTSGTVRHRGEIVESRAQWAALRRDAQYVFQDPYGSLPPRMSVEEILTDPLVIHGIGGSKAQRRERAATMLDEVGLGADALKRRPAAFSGGQRQRISIARALMLDPAVVICDEVVSGLDVSVQAQVLNLLLDLHESRGLGLLFISHDLRVIRYLCQRVIVLLGGRIVESQSADGLFEAPQHEYTKTLLASSPEHLAKVG